MGQAFADVPSHRIAVLVDADNVQSGHIEFAVEQLAARGVIVLKRAFGLLDSLRAREQTLARLGFGAEVALTATTGGKNAADVLLALYSTRLVSQGAVDAVAIVSSDGDFAPVARALAEAGATVIGCGRADASLALQRACASFILFPEAVGEGTELETTPTASDPELDRFKRIVIGAMENGSVRLQALGTKLNGHFGGDYKKRFQVRTLSELIGKVEGLQLKGEGTEKLIVRAPSRCVSHPTRPAASG